MIHLYYLRLIDFCKKNIPHNRVHDLSNKLMEKFGTITRTISTRGIK